MTERRAS